MAKLKVSLDMPMSPEDAWSRASDLAGFEQWLSIHEAWRSELPDELAAGTTVSSIVTVKGLRNRITWTLQQYEPPRRLVLKGDGKGGVKLGLVLSVVPADAGAAVALDIDLGGAPLFGPIGSGVARALRGDIESSLQKFVALYA
ncbi:type II toxin-antitoxin system Rv0910 family toxin [Rhodococcus sp. SGAir0479]|uniref:type II toxin-antitoxin system Rv0910 family toxin n=1 Tax=Rhodococcus sp. SGAir0479 TaxID=2567884 RepID=UPI0010CCCACB|nr:SRPBCC family protein [Rhodococcus sp. SGAir0479]QCQ89970.1 SRPBCC family protein [Rhodococcus sp. SGAir0479]